MKGKQDERGMGLFLTCGERFVFAWLVGVLGFILACIVDLDHLVVLIQKGIPISWKALATEAGRPAHVPLFFIVGLVCICLFTYLSGWAIRTWIKRWII